MIYVGAGSWFSPAWNIAKGIGVCLPRDGKLMCPSCVHNFKTKIIQLPRHTFRSLQVSAWVLWDCISWYEYYGTYLQLLGR